MKYQLEELSQKIEWKGKQAELMITCEIEITEHEYQEAEPDVGIMHAGYSASDFDIVGDVQLFIFNGGIEEELLIPADTKNLEQLILIEVVKIFIRNNADWEAIDEKLTEYHSE